MLQAPLHHQTDFRLITEANAKIMKLSSKFATTLTQNQKENDFSPQQETPQATLV